MSQTDAVRDLEIEFSAMVRRGRIITRDLARAVHPRLDPTAFSLVAYLARNDPKRVSELAAILSLDKSTVSRQIDAVSRLGLVERRPDPADARARLVTLTEDGRATVNTQLDRYRDRMRRVLNTWDVAEVTELARLLHKAGETGIF